MTDMGMTVIATYDPVVVTQYYCESSMVVIDNRQPITIVYPINHCVFDCQSLCLCGCGRVVSCERV